MGLIASSADSRMFLLLLAQGHSYFRSILSESAVPVHVRRRYMVKIVTAVKVLQEDRFNWFWQEYTANERAKMAGCSSTPYSYLHWGET